MARAIESRAAQPGLADECFPDRRATEADACFGDQTQLLGPDGVCSSAASTVRAGELRSVAVALVRRGCASTVKAIPVATDGWVLLMMATGRRFGVVVAALLRAVSCKSGEGLG